MADDLNKDMEMWLQLRDANPKNIKDIQKMLHSVGYTPGEIEELTGKLKLKKLNKIEEIREELYIRHKMRVRLLNDHIKDTNLLSTLDSMRADEAHLLECLQKLGELMPATSQATEFNGTLRIEPLIFASIQKTKELQEVNPQIIDVPNETDSE